MIEDPARLFSERTRGNPGPLICVLVIPTGAFNDNFLKKE